MPTYSNTMLSMYENCPLQYKYAYVDRIELEKVPENIEAFMGRRVHETLFKLYHDMLLSRLNTLEDLHGYYHDIWEKNWSDDIAIVKKGYTWKDYYDTGRRCISDYYNRYMPFNDSRTIGLEQKVRINIDGYRLTGIIDRLSRRDNGHYEIHDYKTSQSLPQQSCLNGDRQLGLYQIGIEDSQRDVESVDLIWHYLVHDEELRSRHSADDIRKLKQEVVSLILEIERAGKEDIFPARESLLCNWCGYRGICQAHKQVSAAEDLSPPGLIGDRGMIPENSPLSAFQKRKA